MACLSATDIEIISFPRRTDGAAVEGSVPKLSPMMYEASDGFSVGIDQGSFVSPETINALAAPVALVRFEYAQASKPRG